jgi:hypothetical protein
MCIICNKEYNINIIKIEIINCKKVTEIPKELINLEEIIIIKCDNFNKIHNTFTKLKKLYIHYFNNIPDIPVNFTNLEELQLDFCPEGKQMIFCYSENKKHIRNYINYVNSI